MLYQFFPHLVIRMSIFSICLLKMNTFLLPDLKGYIVSCKGGVVLSIMGISLANTLILPVLANHRTGLLHQSIKPFLVPPSQQKIALKDKTSISFVLLVLMLTLDHDDKVSDGLPIFPDHSLMRCTSNNGCIIRKHLEVTVRDVESEDRCVERKGNGESTVIMGHIMHTTLQLLPQQCGLNFIESTGKVKNK